MSTAIIVDSSKGPEEPRPRRSNSQRPGRSQGAPLAPPAERLRARRFSRIARIGDSAIAVIVLLGSFLAVNLDRMPDGFQGFLEIRLTIRNLLLVLGYTVAWRLICSLAGLYDEKKIRDSNAEARRILAAVTIGSALALIFPLISVTRAFSHQTILFYWAGSVAGMLLFRASFRTLLHAPLPQGHDVLIVGSGPRALTLYYGLFGSKGNGFRLLGFVDTAEGEMAPEVQSRLLGDLQGLESILMHHAVDEVLIALPVRSRYSEIQRVIEICERGGVPARYLGDVFQHRRNGNHHSLPVETLTAVVAQESSDDGRLIVKRCADVVLGVLALAALSPLLVISAVAIKVTTPGPILFTQERYGLNKRRFRMYKFRTMVADAESQQHLLEEYNEASGPVFKIRDDPRLTRVGKLLRRLSIDELPQLFNVLRGEMSLVGPRPLPLRDVSGFSEPALMRRFSVYPGITGLWQVSGRSELGFDEWIRLDLKYIDEWSLLLDFRILVRTVPAVLHARGAV